ncbi:MAG: response regulator [Rubrivivax sp.]|nr:response regulator [Rubrivivax sp.]
MPKTILVIDDSAVMRTLQSQALTRAGYQVVEATDGLDAQAKVAGIDGVLCDINMPNLDGLGFLRWLRGQPATRRVPFVFMTTETRPAQKEAGRVLGAHAWVSKPCPPERLVQTVQQVCPL